MRFPEFFERAPVVRVRDPLAAMLGAPGDGVIEYRYADAVRLAGHSCPTVASAFLMGRAALGALYPSGLPERGSVAVRMPAPEHQGTIGVTAQVLTLLTGAAADNGFKGLGGRFARHGLLTFEPSGTDAVVFQRIDNRAAVAVAVDAGVVPADPAQRDLFGVVMQGAADAGQLATFGAAFQSRVRRLLLEHADDPSVIHVHEWELAERHETISSAEMSH